MALAHESVATSITLGDGLVEITHLSPDVLNETSGAIVLRELGVTPNVLSQLRKWVGEERRTVSFLWRRQSMTRGMSFMVSSDGMLFIGAETFAAAVNLRSAQVIDSHSVELFWSFKQVGDYVFEFGELSCFLRSRSGEILGEASVDPPYEIHESSEGIRFESIVMGTQWLCFPASTKGQPTQRGTEE